MAEHAERCKRCGSLNGHDLVGDAECALTEAHRVELTRLAGPDDASLRVALWDLYAHYRSVFNAPQAYKAARYAIELGWRPSVKFDATAAVSGSREAGGQE